MARGTQSSPWIYEAQDNAELVLRITVSFNNGNRGLTSALIHRDAGCQYAHIYLGTGADGLPDSTPQAFAVPTGDTSVTSAQLAAIGLSTIEDILALQITAGP